MIKTPLDKALAVLNAMGEYYEVEGRDDGFVLTYSGLTRFFSTDGVEEINDHNGDDNGDGS